MNNKKIVDKSNWSNDKLEFFPTLNDVLVITAQLSSARRSNTFSTWSIWVIITGSNHLPMILKIKIFVSLKWFTQRKSLSSNACYGKNFYINYILIYIPKFMTSNFRFVRMILLIVMWNVNWLTVWLKHQPIKKQKRFAKKEIR